MGLIRDKLRKMLFLIAFNSSVGRADYRASSRTFNYCMGNPANSIPVLIIFLTVNRRSAGICS